MTQGKEEDTRLTGKSGPVTSPLWAWLLVLSKISSTSKKPFNISFCIWNLPPSHKSSSDQNREWKWGEEETYLVESSNVLLHRFHLFFCHSEFLIFTTIIINHTWQLLFPPPHPIPQEISAPNSNQHRAKNGRESAPWRYFHSFWVIQGEEQKVMKCNAETLYLW